MGRMAKKKSKKKTKEPTEKSEIIEQSEPVKEPSEDMSFDFSKAKNAFKGLKIGPVLPILILILIPMIMAIHFRVDSAHLPITDEWAENSVYNQIRNQITNQINQQYPNLPATNKQELINQQFNLAVEQQQDVINQNIEGTSNYFKSRLQNSEGQTYFLAIDPWQWYRRLANWEEKGHYYDEIKNGRPWNNHMIAPIGQHVDNSWHLIFSYYIYKLVNIFNKNISLFTVFFFIPVIFAALSVIPAFFLARRKAGNFGGFMAASILAVHTSFVGRTAAGFSDTDAYNIFFPLLITWIFLEAFDAKTFKKRFALAALAGILIGIFSNTWGGWWYIFDFLLIVIVAYIIYEIVKEILRKDTNLKEFLTSGTVINTLTTGAVFFIFSAIIVSYYADFPRFVEAFSGPLKFKVFKAAAHSNLWPNVFTTVAELGNTSLGTIVNSIGGKLFFFISMLGLILTMIGDKFRKRDYLLIGGSALVFLLLVSNKFLGMAPIKYLTVFAIPLVAGLFLTLKGDEVDVKYALFLTVWFAGTIYASTKGVRFILLLVPAYSVAFGIGVGRLQQMITNILKKELKMKDWWVSYGVMILLLLLLIGPLKAADVAARNEVPSMNDAWWEALTEIKATSQPDAIINSWWDFGHWFKAIADRAVTFDGASQNTPMAHWIGKTLLSPDEKQAIGILRMLDCGSNNAFNELQALTGETVYSVNVLNEIMIQDKVEARKTLTQKGLSNDQADMILELTHCEPPENYFITSQDMVSKAGVWAHFGSWSFERAYIYNNLRHKSADEAVKEMIDKFGYTEDEASTLYYEAISKDTDEKVNAWISPWPGYVTGWSGSCDNNEERAICSIGHPISTQGNQRVVIEAAYINKTDIKSSVLQFGAYDINTGARVGGSTGIPTGFTIAGEEITRYGMSGSTFGYDILYDAEQNRAMILHSSFSKALFTKLFFMDGRYTENFEKFSDKQQVNGQRILVWKVKWPTD